MSNIPELVQLVLHVDTLVKGGKEWYGTGAESWRLRATKLAEHIASSAELTTLADMIARIRELERERDVAREALWASKCQDCPERPHSCRDVCSCQDCMLAAAYAIADNTAAGEEGE